MSVEVPKVSLIIPSHNRSTSLRRTLDALDRQDCGPAIFEVIVSLDGCTDGSEQMLADATTAYQLSWVSGPASGAAVARNRGVTRARGPLLLFIDDDIEPMPGFVSAHLAAHEASGEPSVVIGYSKPV